MKHFSKFLAVIILVLAVGSSTIASTLIPQTASLIHRTDGSHTPQMELIGSTWDLLNKESLKVLVIPAPNVGGWSDSFVVNVGDAIAEWESCIARFTDSYGYSYLKRIGFAPDVQGIGPSETESYDITVTWVESFMDPEIAGRTMILSDTNGRLQKVSITLATTVFKDGRNYVLDNTDMTSLLAEELGHALGLGHANTVNDLMYGYTSFPRNPACHSTLNMYGLALAYSYLSSREFRPPRHGALIQLPQGMQYLQLLQEGHGR